MEELASLSMNEEENEESKEIKETLLIKHEQPEV